MTGSRSKDLTIRMATTGMITNIESNARISSPGRRNKQSTLFRLARIPRLRTVMKTLIITPRISISKMLFMVLPRAKHRRILNGSH